MDEVYKSDARLKCDEIIEMGPAACRYHDSLMCGCFSRDFEKWLFSQELPVPSGLSNLSNARALDIGENSRSSGKHIYFLTLTLDSEHGFEDLMNGFKKIVNSDMFGVQKYIRCIELTKKGTPHIHAMLHVKYYMEKAKVLKLYKSGFVHLEKVKSIIKVNQYINKCKEDPDTNLYLENQDIQYIQIESYPDALPKAKILKQVEEKS